MVIMRRKGEDETIEMSDGESREKAKERERESKERELGKRNTWAERVPLEPATKVSNRDKYVATWRARLAPFHRVSWHICTQQEARLVHLQRSELATKPV